MRFLGFRRALACCAPLFGAALASATAYGDLTIEVPNISLPFSANPQSGSFNVLIVATGVDTTDKLDGFQVDLYTNSVYNSTVAPVAFTGVTIDTTAANVFNSAPYGAPGGAGGPYLTNVEAANSDTPATVPGPVLSQAYSLERVSYTVAGGFTGSVPLVLNLNYAQNDPVATYVQIDNGSGTALPATAVGIPGVGVTVSGISGSISVAAVPEPSGLLLAGTAGLALIGLSRRRRSARA